MRMKFLALNVNFSSLEVLTPRFKEACAREREKEISPLKSGFLPLLARITWKWLQIGTDLLLIITSTGDDLSSGANIDDLEW